jgi:dipeptidyl aminopeptidase/acylaminoacyl peptidase
MKAYRPVCSLLAIVATLSCHGHAQLQKPPITLNEFLNTTEVREARLSPDGLAVVVATSVPDWQHNRFREDLWLWSEKSGSLMPLTQSGHDSSAEWSPDGRYIAFTSDRPLPGDDAGSGKDDGGDAAEGTSRIWIISPEGGEAFPLYREKLDVHALAWAPDSSTIFFSTPDPLSKQAEEALKTEWKDVIRWREQERGDVLIKMPLAAAIAEQKAIPVPNQKEPESSAIPVPKGATVLSHSRFAIDSIVPAPSGDPIAINTVSISRRMENPDATEIYLVSASGGDPRQITHNTALESNLHWSPDGKHIYFSVRAAAGSLEEKYQDVQGRLYVLDPETGKVDRLGSDFKGSWEDYTVASDGSLIVVGLTGIEQQVYVVKGTTSKKLPGVAGTYGGVYAAMHGDHLLFTHSTIDSPTQVYVARDLSGLGQAKAVTAFNPIFAERATPQWKPYTWKSDDGTSVEGVLIYPPGKLEAKHLPMFTFIHGGPADADGNRFGADWYDWATLAAAKGWLVFRPNYRGSSGYGDKFMLDIAPHLVSAPGKDILAGVDALVKEGIADPDRLAIGGYSYGGYMTNWLITQTTRFKAAVTGAGAVEHAANWGNDDVSFDDGWYLNGAPWEKPEIYQSEAALFQFNKVKTPTHLVGGNADVRVSFLEDVLMERALEALQIPHSLLVFPGEGHGLGKNPWHGYIKVRDEIKWLDKYAGTP